MQLGPAQCGLMVVDKEDVCKRIQILRFNSFYTHEHNATQLQMYCFESFGGCVKVVAGF